eukprot:gnl/TRDRNA2_/TRDRNA2_155627_c0_seq1.p1 gnl/TRDRNA2_/TRDRNA2_155627_c0~~gnl/TRDRNA2_/TRDRNA2_155627_c0_seq1.p1  ORF type:complete len:285 (+),score=63.97 gnl/TRDRNA2_/TRDRNA2_155627_c0_seq1:97-855(+)
MDALPTHLAAVFAGGSVSDEALAAHAAESGQSVDLGVLRTLISQGGTESFRLATPTAANGWEGVNAYLDEAAVLKGLQRNMRANELVVQCGYPANCELRGDIFVGRVKWAAGGTVTNLDFQVSDLQPSSLWLQRAPVENLQEQASTRPEEHAKAQASASDDGKPACGEGEGYTWKDEGEEVEIVVAIEKGTTKRDVKVDFKRQELRISKPISITLKLFKPVEVDGCSWTISDAKIVLTLEKVAKVPWHQLLA